MLILQPINALCQRRVRAYETRFCAHNYTVEDLEFLDTPVYIDTYVVTLHEYNTIMTVLIVSVQQISYSITLVVNFV